MFWGPRPPPGTAAGIRIGRGKVVPLRFRYALVPKQWCFGVTKRINMVQKTLPNQGRQSGEKWRRHRWGKLKRVLKSPKTLSLLMGWMRFAVAVVRLFDRW